MGEFTTAPLCSACLDALDRLESPFSCSACGLPFETTAPLHGVQLCGLCRRRPPAFELARSFGAYEGNLRRVVHLFKYEGMRPLARPLARHMAGLLREFGPVDLIVPVPLHRFRRWRRGYNQSALLTKELSRLTGLPSRAGVLRRVRATQPQFGLPHRQRRLNMQGAFTVAEREAIRGRKILLVDDVMTTGATLEACAGVLKAADCQSVAALTVARAKRRITEWAEPSRPAHRPGVAEHA